MTRVVYGFPGQGSQVPGMGRGMFERFAEHTRAADRVLGYSIERLCEGQDVGRLRLTEFAQPALYVVGALSYLQRVRDDPEEPAFFIGHSLGEYVALFASGVFDFETGLRLVQQRGALMSREDTGGMAAVVGCDLDEVQCTLRDAAFPSLDIANVNGRRQMVLSGPIADIQRARGAFEARGARYVPLEVSAAFHSRYMREVAAEFARALERVHVRRLRVPAISNLTARPYQYESLRETLAWQIDHPVKWLQSIEFIMSQGEFRFEELGPGKTLTKLVNQIREQPAVPNGEVVSTGATC